MRELSVLSLCAAMIAPHASVAQSPQAPVQSTVPGLTRMTAANAAGILKYCAENDILSGLNAETLMTGLITKTDQTSVDFIVGSSGQILGDEGKNFSISRAPAHLQTQACNMVLERSRTFRR